MSDTQFSSLSPNSSNDLSNRYNEENDQETLSIVSNLDGKTVANLDDFDDGNERLKTDPFLSDFVKEECEDNVFFTEKSKMQPFNDNLSTQNLFESNDMNFFFYSMSAQDDMDEYLSVGVNCVNEVSSDLMEWVDIPQTVSLSDQKFAFNPNSNKRFLPNQDHCNFSSYEIFNKQRKLDISPQLCCQEWINKLNKRSENLSFKASGMLDRRKTKHNPIVSDQDVDLCEEKAANSHPKIPKSAVNKNHLQAKLSPIYVKFNSVRKPLSVSIISKRDSNFRPVTVSRNLDRKTYHNVKEYLSNKNITHTTLTKTLPTSNSQSPNSSNVNRIGLEVIDISHIPEPLRMGKRINRRGQRFSLWQFLMCLLDSSKYKEHCTGIKWVHRNCGIFHIIDSKQIATLWGQYKERREKMTYDSLARSLRHYYKKNLMAKINNRRLVYQIAQECLQWSGETFLKRNKD